LPATADIVEEDAHVSIEAGRAASPGVSVGPVDPAGFFAGGAVVVEPDGVEALTVESDVFAAEGAGPVEAAEGLPVGEEPPDAAQG